jgi:aspartyl-tRNA(Asn)/glutamyl-tRNA(Gln) amidotransferase subunit A
MKKEFSALEVCQFFLDRIETLDKKIKAFLTVTPDLALSQAKEVDEQISKGEKISLLAGVPLVLKDNILVEGVRCTAGSKILENYVAPYDAFVVKELKKQGAVILGKTNLDEFAMGSSTEHSGFFPTHNPHDLERVPGGSSGGSAAAVAADMCVYALGSDTYGSVRQPASFCGVVGLKPTYGTVSRYGLIAMASSLDQIGPITKNIEDARIVFETISVLDPLDSTNAKTRPKINWDRKSLKGLKVGVPKEYFIEGMDKEVEIVIKQAIEKFEKGGAEILEIPLPYSRYAVASYYVTTPCEISANLARYDGIRYGLSLGREESKTLLDIYLESRGQGFGDEVKRRIMLGTFALSVGYYDAYYLKAQKVRTLVKKDFERAFQRVEVILTPTAPTPAFKIGEKIEDPLSMYLSDVFTGPVNSGGLSAVSLPAGKSKTGLPIGLQIIGKPFEEEVILRVGEMFEALSN